MTELRCFFEGWPDVGPCDGRLIKAHLIKRQTLTREGYGRLIHDRRTWVPCCGGPQGNAGHHGRLDGGQLRIPREKLPKGFVDLMGELGLSWCVAKHYGESRSARLGARV
jgi:hypothetical protein